MGSGQEPVKPRAEMTSRRQFLEHALSAGASALFAGCSSARQPPPARAAFRWGIGIENTWMMQADPAKDGMRRPLDEFELTQHYERWEDDIRLAADLGITTIRYSLPWSRAEPLPGSYDLGWLDGPLALMAELEIEPVFDLIHYGTPAWMGDGIGDERFPDALAAYAAHAAEQLGERVTRYTVHNEPQVSALLSGITGTWPPYASSTNEWAALGTRIARAMVLASQTLRAARSDVALISAEAIHWLAAGALFPDTEDEDLVLAVGSFPSSLAYGKVAPGHPFAELLVELGVPASELSWLFENAEPPDVLGYNHYPDIADFPGAPDFTREGALPLADAAREAALRVEEKLRRAQRYFELPVCVSETSAGLAGEARAAYATALGEMVARLRAEAFPLVGLSWWPLYEAVQWAYRDHPELPLSDFIVPGGWNNGLYDLAIGPAGELERVPSPAVAAFRAIVDR